MNILIINRLKKTNMSCIFIFVSYLLFLSILLLKTNVEGAIDNDESKSNTIKSVSIIYEDGETIELKNLTIRHSTMPNKKGYRIVNPSFSEKNSLSLGLKESISSKNELKLNDIKSITHFRTAHGNCRGKILLKDGRAIVFGHNLYAIIDEGTSDDFKGLFIEPNFSWSFKGVKLSDGEVLEFNLVCYRKNPPPGIVKQKMIREIVFHY